MHRCVEMPQKSYAELDDPWSRVARVWLQLEIVWGKCLVTIFFLLWCQAKKSEWQACSQQNHTTNMWKMARAINIISVEKTDDLKSCQQHWSTLTSFATHYRSTCSCASRNVGVIQIHDNPLVTHKFIVRKLITSLDPCWLISWVTGS